MSREGDLRPAGSVSATRLRRVEARSDQGRWIMRPVTLAEVQAQFPSLTETQLREGRQLMGLDVSRLGDLRQGEDFAMSLPGLPSRQALVERVDEDAGMRRISGSLLSADDRGTERFSLTFASDRTFLVGHLWMGGREYALHMRNGVGWWSRAGLFPVDS